MPTDPKTVRSYDDNAATWAENMRAGKSSAHRFLEKPAMRAMLPELASKDVLAIGAGSAEEYEFLAATGARVVATDISAGLVAEARTRTPAGDFRVMDMEKLDFPRDSFDFVYSSLALHYLESWKAVLSRVRVVLRPGGKFLFSVHHPVAWGAASSKDTVGRHSYLGYTKKRDDTVEIHGDYLTPRPISNIYMNTIEVTYWNRPISDMLRDIREAGFELLDMQEPKATSEAKKTDPAFWEIRQKIPLFVIFLVTRK